MSNFDEIKLENQIKRLEDATREAYDDIFDWGNPGYTMKQYKTNTDRYKRAKEEYDKVYPAYVKLKAENDRKIAALKVELDKLTEAERKEKEKKKTGKTLAEAKDEYQRAVDSQDPARIAAAKVAVQEARTKYGEVKDPKPEGTVDETKGDTKNPYADPAKYTLNTNGTVSFGGNQVFLVTVPDAKDGTVTTGYNSIAQARAAYVKAYASTPEQVAALKKQLVASGYAKQSEVDSDDWYSKLDDAITEYTTHVVSQAQFGGVKSPDLPTDFFKIKKAGAGSGTSGIQHTTRGAAKQAIDAYAMDLRGEAATPEEAEAYYKELIKAEGKAGTSGLIAAEDTMIAANVLRKSLKGSNVDELLSKNSGSRVATDIASLQQYAADYGVDMSPADALKYVANGIGQKDYLAKQEERIRQLSMTLHPYLKDHIAAGGTVADVANQYANRQYKKLGKPVTTPTKDSNIMSAIARGVSLDQWDRELQSNPDWRKSEEANSMVSNFIDNLGKMWGRG